jgi:predicted RNA-binding protein YlqC (UPF0109 family)
MRELLIHLFHALVSDPDALDITRVDGDTTTLFEVRCAPEDVGTLIGKNGKTISAIRTLMNAVGDSEGRQVAVEVLEPC